MDKHICVSAGQTACRESYPQAFLHRSRCSNLVHMADEKHLYMTVRGGYNVPSLADEMWMFGLRLVLNFGNVDDIGDLPNNWNALDTEAGRLVTGGYVETNWYASGPAASSFSPDDWLEDVAAPAVKKMWTAKDPSNYGHNNRAVLQEIRLYPILGGQVVPVASGPARATYYFDPDVAGTGPGGMAPPEVAVAVTTNTKRFDRTGRGRFFLPAIDSGHLGSDGSLTTAAQDHFVARADTFISEVGSLGGLTQNARVIPAVIGGPSKKNPTGWNRYAKITSVAVGNIPDSQHRRRNRLRETYVTRSVTD